MRNPDQAALHKLEALCTQEQPPACMSGCPLHTDGRSICAAVSLGDFDSALAIYKKTVLFPGILSHTCSQHCSAYCQRKALGGSLLMRGIEEAVYKYGKAKKGRSFLPRRNHRAAVVGGGISGLTAALELAKKGCKVTVYEKEEQIGGQLLHQEIPREILEQDFSVLKEYPITLLCSHSVQDIDALAEEYDAVYVAWGVQTEEHLQLTSDSASYESQHPKVFAGGHGIRRQAYDTALSMADGKRAAVSIDRYLKQVSMMAGREKEEMYQTTLYVNTRNKLPVQSSHIPPFSSEEAMEEAQRCLDCKCMECVNACAFLKEYKTFPRKYVREVYNNLSIAMGTRHANRMINSCALCGQCGAICPFGLDVGKVTKEAREIMVENEKMPVSSFEFGLRDMEHANSEELSLLCHQPGYNKSSFLFFPGCQIGASNPDLVFQVYQDLTRRIPEGIGLFLGCCGITADWAGEQSLFRKNIASLREAWSSMGKPRIITACPTCWRVWKEEIPQADPIGIWDILDTWPAFQPLITAHKCSEAKSLTVMDACGARQFEDIHQTVRHLLIQLGYELKPHTHEKEQSGCCGFGGLMPVSNQKLAKKMAASQVSQDADCQYLTYCMNCRDRYTDTGAQAVHLLELIYCQDQAACHRPPTWSDRQRRRRWLKKRLLGELWQKETESRKEMNLYYNDKMKEQLEERMILEEDLWETIAHAEEHNEKILDTVQNCMIAGRRIGNVYFWVYYRPAGDGYEILKAYSHRMNFR